MWASILYEVVCALCQELFLVCTWYELRSIASHGGPLILIVCALYQELCVRGVRWRKKQCHVHKHSLNISLLLSETVSHPVMLFGARCSLCISNRASHIFIQRVFGCVNIYYNYMSTQASTHTVMAVDTLSQLCPLQAVMVIWQCPCKHSHSSDCMCPPKHQLIIGLFTKHAQLFLCSCHALTKVN